MARAQPPTPRINEKTPSGALPFAGGSAEQPSCVMDALLVMEAAASRLKATPRPEED